MAREEIRRRTVAKMRQLTGKRYARLEVAIETMDVEAVLDLHRMFGDVEFEIQVEKRSFRPFPGGPKVRY